MAKLTAARRQRQGKGEELTVERKGHIKNDRGGGAEGWGKYATPEGYITQLDSAQEIDLGGKESVRVTHKAFIKGSVDLKKGDRITDQDDQQYFVHSVGKSKGKLVVETEAELEAIQSEQ